MVASLVAAAAGLMAGQERTVDARTLVTVNGRGLTAEDVFVLSQLAPESDATDEALAALIGRAVERELIFQRGESLGLVRYDAIMRGRLLHLVRELAAAEADAAAPSEDELRAFYDAHRDAYRVASRTRFDEIVSRDRDSGRSSQVIDRAHERLEAGETWDAVRTELADPAPFDWGDAALDEGTVERQYGAAFADTLRETPVGDVSEPVRTDFGLHLIRVRAREGGRAMAFEEARDRVLIDATTSRSRRAVADWLERTRSEADVWIAPDAIARVRQAVLASQASEGNMQ